MGTVARLERVSLSAVHLLFCSCFMCVWWMVGVVCAFGDVTMLYFISVLPRCSRVGKP